MQRLATGLLVALASCVFVGLGAVGFSITSDVPIPLGNVFPDRVVYRFHAAVGDALNSLNIAPVRAATQWERAASHASTPFDVTRAAAGIQTSRAQSSDTWSIDDELCTTFVHGSAAVRTAINETGVACTDDAGYFSHVPDGSPVIYSSRPPIGGPHYSHWYPSYGVVEEDILPGYWVHNLEHGAVVLLYRCPDGCPDLVAQLRAFYDEVPRGHNERHSGPRLLITPYADQDHLLSIVAWGHKLQVDAFNSDSLIAFYNRFIDRGPECNNISCPD